MAADTMTNPRAGRTGGGTAGPLTVFRGVVSARRRSLALWSLAIGAVAALYASFYPAMGENGEAMEPFMEGMPEGVVSALGLEQIASAAGYLQSTVFGLLGPALLLVFSIGWGARTLAGTEEDGTLELELTHPVSRTRVFLDRLLALWLGAGLLALTVFVVVAVLATVLDMELGVGRVAAAGVSLLLLGVALGTVALATGAATGRRGVAIATAAAVAVLSFVANAIGPLVDGLGWLSTISPWTWYIGGDPLFEGFDWGGLALLAALAVVAGAAGLLRYRQRDLGV